MPTTGTLFLPDRLHIAVCSALAALTLALVFISASLAEKRFWADWQESGNLRRPNYAERIYPENFFRIRANIWSNLAYVAVCFYALAFARHDRRRPRAPLAGYLVQTRRSAPLRLDLHLARRGQRDVSRLPHALRAIARCCLDVWRIDRVHRDQPRSLAARDRLGRDRPPLPTWPFFGGLVVIARTLLFRYKWSMSATNVLSTLILSGTVLGILDRFHLMRRMAMRWAFAFVAALVAGITCRQLDVAGRFSGPDAWLQGHAHWHVLTAASLGCTYLYYRSEVLRPPPAPPPPS